MSEQIKAILKKGNAAIAVGDYEGFLSLCTDDTVWTFVGDKILDGKEAVRQWMTKEYVEPPENTVTHLIAEGEFLTALGEITVTDKEGKATHYSYCDVWRFHDDRMVELKAFVVEIESEDKSSAAA